VGNEPSDAGNLLGMVTIEGAAIAFACTRFPVLYVADRKAPHTPDYSLSKKLLAEHIAKSQHHRCLTTAHVSESDLIVAEPIGSAWFML
jgi:hypothetical protein